jgi:hypothetical protein
MHRENAMKVICTALLISLAATAAFGQGAQITPVPNGMLGTNVYLRSSSADGDSAALADLVTRALDKSRSLHLVAARIENTMEVQAPVSMITEADGKRVKVTYEVTPPDGDNSQTFTTTCAITQLDRCAEAIALRAERIAREDKMLKGTSDGL